MVGEGDMPTKRGKGRTGLAEKSWEAILGGAPEWAEALGAAVEALHQWYGRHARALPWRDDPTPYRVWVSEVMLQQTRVAAVEPYYRRWFGRFPSLDALARAPLDEVYRYWEGLGYYSRARNLHRAAIVVTTEWGGALPRTVEALGSLPGVGPYTAAAIGSIAFGLDAAVVDGNVRRVLARLTALPHPPTRKPWAGAIERLAQELLPPGRGADHNQAMMELGALVCLPRNPACPACPMRDVCKGFAGGAPERYPVRGEKRPVPLERQLVAVVEAAETFLVVQRPPEGLLGGMWEFPGVVWDGEDQLAARDALEGKLRKEFGLAGPWERRGGVEAPLTHAYTHLRVELTPVRYQLGAVSSPAADGGGRWVAREALARLPMGRVHRRIAERL